jgi:ubiquinone/menaquinone biosynthesis C-methylase UbiE
VCEAEYLPWESNYFDACRADRLLQHVTDLGGALNELCRVLKLGGRLVVVDRDWGMVALDSSDEITTKVVLESCRCKYPKWLDWQKASWLFQDGWPQ